MHDSLLVTVSDSLTYHCHELMKPDRTMLLSWGRGGGRTGGGGREEEGLAMLEEDERAVSNLSGGWRGSTQLNKVYFVYFAAVIFFQILSL